jgi:hypothetical protein
LRKIKAILTAAVSALFITMPAVPVSAAVPALQDCFGVTPHDAEEASAHLTKVLRELAGQKYSAPEAATALAAECGTETISKPVGGATTATTNEAIAMSNPQIVHYPQYGIWTVFADWEWRSAPYSDATVGCLSPCKIGGNDGIGFSLSRPVVAVETSSPWAIIAESKNDHFSTHYSTTPSDGNSNGVSFTGQDSLCISKSGTADCHGAVGEHDYSWHTGYILMNIKDIGCGSIQAFSRYAHSWKSTAVTGIGIGPWTVSVSWSATDSQWTAVGPPAEAVVPC